MALGSRKKKRPTKKQVEAFGSEILYNRIAWVAARTIMNRVRNDPAYGGLDAELRLSLETFLQRHPLEFKETPEGQRGAGKQGTGSGAQAGAPRGKQD